MEVAYTGFRVISYVTFDSCGHFGDVILDEHIYECRT